MKRKAELFLKNSVRYKIKNKEVFGMKLSKVIVGISAFAMAAAFSVGTEAVKADAETFNYSGSVAIK